MDRLLFKKESGQNRITINRVCLAIPKRATITWKKLRSYHKFPIWKVPEKEWYPYVSLFPDLLCNIGLSVSGLRNQYVSTAIHSVEFTQKNQFSKKPGFPLSSSIILNWSNLDRLLFKKESGKNRIMINRVCLAIPKRPTITWKKQRS